jgi:hypothetical protein
MKRALLAVPAAVLLLVPASAAADGLPVAGVEGRDGVVSLDGAHRWLTYPGKGRTVVTRVLVDGGRSERFRTIAGRWTIPVVAYDGTGSGVSADGSRLVLIRPRMGLGQKHTRFVVLDTRLQVRKRIVLRGDFSFDAISPDGSTAYLVQYLSLGQRNFDPTNYKVRALDIAGGRLLPSPIVDPREPGEKMGGLPITRATSADGRWAYTLYSGSEHPFIHALDTSGRTARCIDLDALTGREDLFQLRLRVADGGRRIDVVKDDAPQLAVDTSSRSVRKPRPTAPPARPAKPATADDGGGSIWPWAAAAAALLALIGAASARPLARMSRAR